MTDKIRNIIKVYGIVQGVGFRPFVSRIAMENNIYGSVCNKGSYVEIFAQASEKEIKKFLYSLEYEAPPRSLILKIKTEQIPVAEENCSGDGSDAHNGKFNIINSSKEKGLVFVSPDIATCPNCERELFDSENRRYLHPFINCTDCGPRLTILDSMPYDRERTSMGEFPMCSKCEDEYTHASSRRYHAQPVCCNDCGPELYIIGRNEKNKDAVIYARKMIKEGKIVAIKGIGGFHLCCDAANNEAVERLRKLKNRPSKPFAVMMKNMETVRRECHVYEGEEDILNGSQKPIILLERKEGQNRLSSAVAPGNPNVGVMLPYAPLQMLLFRYPDNQELSDCFVMTSGNPSGAPICRTDDDAVKYLSNMCDAILSNAREIRIRADDTVMSFYAGKPYMIRRSRGYAPLPVIMPEESKHSVLGIGGELKNTFCLGMKDMFYLSPYIGDMADLRSVKALDAAVTRLETLLEITPEAVACDMHPKYNSTQFAKGLGLPVIEIQHHYAHIVSCMAENGYTDNVIGVSFDGTGFGTDGTIWGGEFMRADYSSFQRLGSIKPFRHAGRDMASREGWRIAAAILVDTYDDRDKALEVIGRLGLGEDKTRKAQLFMLDKGINTIKSTSAGRLYDAASAVLGIKQCATFEGEASMALEFRAEKALKDGKKVECPFDESELLCQNEKGFYLNTNELIRYLAEAKLSGGDSDELALLFHRQLAEMIEAGVKECSRLTGLKTVALSGGVFQNILLLDECINRLRTEEYKVLKHSLVAANDGGIALGQAVAAAKRLENS